MQKSQIEERRGAAARDREKATHPLGANFTHVQDDDG